MKRRGLSILLVLAMGISLLAGCGADDRKQDNSETTTTQGLNHTDAHDTTAGTDTDADQNGTETTGSQSTGEATATAVIEASYGEEAAIELTYRAELCEVQSNDEYYVSIVDMDDGYVFDIGFWAGYTAEQHYAEETAAFADMGLEASELVCYASELNLYGFEFVEAETGEIYSFRLLVDVEGGMLVVYNPFVGVDNEEYARSFAENVFVSAKPAEAGGNGNSDDSAETRIALTNEEKENVYGADYQAIKDQIAEEVKDGNEVSYLDAEGRELMFVYYDGGLIEDVFFYRYDGNGTLASKRVYAFDENGEYGIMEFEYYENGNKKSETVYNEDGRKMVISFDESGNYVSMTEYDKDGNIIE